MARIGDGVFVFLLTSLLMGVGCQKPQSSPSIPTRSSAEAESGSAGSSGSQEPTEQSGSPASAVVPAKPLPPPPRVVAARADNLPRQSVDGEVDAFLTGELRNFIAQKQRLPASFTEFAGARLDSIPRPPEGTRWVIDTADLQVKAVPAK